MGMDTGMAWSPSLWSSNPSLPVSPVPPQLGLPAELLNNSSIHLQKPARTAKANTTGLCLATVLLGSAKNDFTNYLTEIRSMEVEEITVKTFPAVLSVVCFSSSVKSLLARTEWSLELVASLALSEVRCMIQIFNIYR